MANVYSRDQSSTNHSVSSEQHFLTCSMTTGSEHAGRRASRIWKASSFVRRLWKCGLPELHLYEIIAINGSIHLTNAETLLATLSDKMRLRKTRKSASWDSTTLLLRTISAPKIKQKGIYIIIQYNKPYHTYCVYIHTHTHKYDEKVKNKEILH